MGTILIVPLIRITEFVWPFQYLLSMLNCSVQDESLKIVIFSYPGKCIIEKQTWHKIHIHHGS